MLRLRQERGLDVELREFGLAIGAQILIAKAAHDLIVAVEACDHQQLLEDLRRLRQREELARMRAARHEIVARALRRRLGQHRRLKIDEAVRIEKAAHRARDAMAQAQALAHDLATQIEVAVFEAHLLVHRLIELKRQRLAAIQHLHFLGDELDGAGGQVAYWRCRPGVHARGPDADDELIAQSLGLREHRRLVGIKHHLQQALAIAQVDEDDAAMIAPPMHPAGHLDLLVRERRIDLSAVMATHGGRPCGATTPSVTIIFMAASTLMDSSITSVRGTMTMKPEVGLGVVGMNTHDAGHAGLDTDLAQILGGEKADAPHAGARIRNEHHLAKGAVLREGALGETLHASVDGAHQRDALQQLLPDTNELPPDEVGDEESRHEHDEKGHERAQAR